MANIHGGTTSYPSAIDTASTILSTDTVIPQHQNGPGAAIVAVETELGTSPKGTSADVATRLNTLTVAVTATSPVTSTGGNNPVIALAAATTGLQLFASGTTWTTGYFRGGTGITVATATGGWATITGTAALSSKVVQTNFNMANATAAYSVTGAGFKPTCLYLQGAINNQGVASWGMIDSVGSTGNQGFASTTNAGIFTGGDTNALYVQDQNFNGQSFAWTSWDADGVTLQRTKFGLPTGTCYLNFLFLK